MNTVTPENKQVMHGQIHEAMKTHQVYACNEYGTWNRIGTAWIEQYGHFKGELRAKTWGAGEPFTVHQWEPRAELTKPVKV